MMLSCVQLILLFQEAAAAIRQLPMLLLQPLWVSDLSLVTVLLTLQSAEATIVSRRMI